MPATFQDETTAVVAEIRDLFAEVIESKCGSSIGLPEVCEGFGIHRKLAWQLTKVAYADDPFHAARYMPTPKGIETWVRSAAERGVDAALLDRVTDESTRFERLVETHAGSRTAMDMLLESCVEEPSEEIDVRWRQRAFEGNGYIWGVQARTIAAFTMLAPSKTKPGWLDIAQVRSLIDFRRMRPDTRWMIGQGTVTGSGEEAGLPVREPLDPETARKAGGVPVMGAFTSDPLPALERRDGEPPVVIDDILPGRIGQAGQLTLTTGEIIRDLAPASATEPGQRAHFGTGVSTPAEMLVYDHFVHKELFGEVQRELCVFGELGRPYTHDERDQLRVPEKIQRLGRGLDRVHTPDAPGYATLLRDAFARCGWDANEFDLYRVRMAYPPLSTSVMIRHELPEPAEWPKA